MDLAALTVEVFEPHVGGAFAVADAGVELVLREASPVGEWPGGRRPFRLEFRGPADPLLVQQIHRLEHAGLGALEIFVVPIGRDAGGATYEAIFT